MLGNENRIGAGRLGMALAALLLSACEGGRPLDVGGRMEPIDGADTPTVGGREDLPLLGSRRGGHAWFDFCESQPDEAELPIDPRALVIPGIDNGRAVQFNAYWQDCHLDPEFVGGQPHPETCGELRASVEQGAVIMRGNGSVGQATSFARQETESDYAISAEGYNRMWMNWGLAARPDNFDELVAERYGSPLSNERNPYPLDGEDPNATNGGSGQLPLMFTQIREPDGTWTGNISSTCSLCHGSQIGQPEDGEGLGVIPGIGNATQDLGIMARDMIIAGAPANVLLAITARQRGNNNASFFNLLSLTAAEGPEYFSVLTSGSTATEDTPPWWNVGSRPFKFWDGLYPADATRVDMAFYRGLNSGDTEAQQWAKDHAQNADKWIMNRQAPAYPFEVNEALAQAGAILFHAKDLWAAPLDNPRPRPEGGNGSCASCHGAYSPRFVHAPNFLATPELEGIAGYVTPREIIGTDTARLDTMDEDTTRAYGRTFSAYPESIGTEMDCGPRYLPENLQGRTHGYLAPPLYGVWATAPFLHNGSVPDMWTLLKPEDRPALWRRVSTPARADQEGQVVMGFDTDLHRAFDQERLGWRYDEVNCGSGLGAIPLVDCGIPAVMDESLVQAGLDVLSGNVIAAWNVLNLPVLLSFTQEQAESRKIYNTLTFSQGNEGHDFTSVLTDAERRALIEYMKTL